MSTINALVDLLAADPEIRAFLDQLQSNAVQTPAGGVFSSQINPALFASEPGALGGPTASTIAEKTTLLDRGIGTDRFGIEFARGLDSSPDLGPRSPGARPGGLSAFIPSPANAPATALPTNLRGGFGPAAGPQQGFLTTEGAAQIQATRRQQGQQGFNAAVMSTGLEQTISQLAEAFGSERKIPPISSSLLGAEPLEGAIPGSRPVYGVVAGSFVLGKFASQQEADNVRDIIRRRLSQGPAPPPSLGIAPPGAVVAPLGRKGLEQVDDIRQTQALGLAERRVALGERREERFLFGPARGGRRGVAGGGAGGGGGVGGRPFRVVQRAVKLGPGLGFAMVQQPEGLQLPDFEGVAGLISAESRALGVLSGTSNVRSLSQARQLAGDVDQIRELFDKGVLDTDEAIVAEMLRRRLRNVRIDRETPANVEAALQRLGDRPVGRQEAENALNALGLDRRQSDLIRLQEQIDRRRFEAVRTERRGTEAEGRKGVTATQTTTRFQERITPTERAEERELRGRETRELALARRESQIQDVGERARISQLRLRLQPLDREIASLFGRIRKEEGKEVNAFAAQAELPAGGPDPALIAALQEELARKQAERDALVNQAIPGFESDPLSEFLRGQGQ